MIRRRYLFPVGAAALALSIAAATTGWASWSTSGTGSGDATVGSMTPPLNVSVSTADPAVITWSEAHVTPSGPKADSYSVVRTDSDGLNPETICAAVLPAASECHDTAEAGDNLYIVTAKYHTWTAASDPQGAEPIRTGRFAAQAPVDPSPSDPASPTPTPTPSASPSPTASASASPSPTPTPSATDSPTDAPTPPA